MSSDKPAEQANTDYLNLKVKSQVIDQLRLFFIF